MVTPQKWTCNVFNTHLYLKLFAITTVFFNSFSGEYNFERNAQNKPEFLSWTVTDAQSMPWRRELQDRKKYKSKSNINANVLMY